MFLRGILVFIILVILASIQSQIYRSGQLKNPSQKSRLILFISGLIGAFVAFWLIFPEIPWFIRFPCSIAGALSWAFVAPKSIVDTLER